MPLFFLLLSIIFNDFLGEKFQFYARYFEHFFGFCASMVFFFAYHAFNATIDD